MKVYLSEEQYKQLLANGSITVGNTTVIYNEDDDYMTPVDEYVDLTSHQIIEGTKTFTGAELDYTLNATVIKRDGVTVNGSSGIYTWLGSSGIAVSDDNEGGGLYTLYQNNRIMIMDYSKSENFELQFPSQSGTLAVKSDIKKLYRHDLILNSGKYKDVQFTIYIHNSSPISNMADLCNFIGSNRRVPITCHTIANEYLQIGCIYADTAGFHIETIGIGTSTGIKDTTLLSDWSINGTITAI